MFRLEFGHVLHGGGIGRLSEPLVLERVFGGQAPAGVHLQHLGEQVEAAVVQGERAREGGRGEQLGQVAPEKQLFAHQSLQLTIEHGEMFCND